MSYKSVSRVIETFVLVCFILYNVHIIVKHKGEAAYEVLRCDLLYLSEVGQCLECSDPFMLSFRLR